MQFQVVWFVVVLIRAENTILLPSFVNIGAHVGLGTMVDTWATVGSCAQVGKNVHIAGGAGIGGVLGSQFRQVLPLSR